MDIVYVIFTLAFTIVLYREALERKRIFCVGLGHFKKYILSVNHPQEKIFIKNIKVSLIQINNSLI